MDGKGEQRGGARGTSRRLARFGGFELDVRSAELHKPGGAPVRLSEQPFRILLVLLEHPQEVVLRDELRTRLWPNNTIVEFEHSLNAAVNRLRQVLGDSADKPRFIETLARRGYRFMGSVEWVDLPPPSSVAAAPSLPTGMAGLTGRKVAHYRLLEVLGGGGMGVVYKAEDLKLGRSVALKFLGEEFSHEGREAQRLHREARALSGLDHPNICTVYEVGEHDGRPFIAMQWLDGETLRQRIESAPGRSAFTLAELLETAVCILAGLEAAHEKGIIHRDVKPANIFLTTRGGVKLLDFGLAKAVREADIPPETVITGPPGRAHSNSLTLTGATMGTASYMAPEQVRGETADARSDLFSFGVVLYEMATGRQPFSGATLDQIHAAVLAYSPPAARTLNPEIPAALEAVVEKALQKDPERRFQSAHEMLEPLEALRRPAHARVESPASPADAVPRRRFAIGAGIVLAASLLLGLSWLVQSRLSAPQESIPGRMAVERLTDSGRVENVAISRDGRNLAYTQREGDGVGLWLRRLADHRETPLLPASESTGYRGLTFAPAGDAIYVVRHDTLDTALRYLYVVPAKGGPARKLVEDIDSPVGFSPDGRRLVYTRGIPSASATEIRIADADGGANHVLATVPDTFPDYQPGPAWSPDGRVITTAVMHLRARPRYALLSVDARTGTFSELLPSDYPIGRPLWLPGGEEMLVILQDEELRGQLWGISYPGIATRKLSTDLADYGGRADLDGDGDRLVTIARSANANVWTASASDQWRGHQLTALSSPLRDVLDAPGGGMLVIDGNRIWHLSADGQRREPFTGFQNPMAFARCGPFVVIVQERSEGSELLRVDATGTGALSLAAGDLSLPVCSRDGAWVYYLEFTPFKRIWRVAVTGGRPQQVSRVLGDTVEGRLSLSPDGKILAYAFSETRPTPRTRFALVPTAGGPPVRLLDLPGAVQHGSTGSPILSPDGTRVQFLIVKDGVSNVWQQLLDGGGQYPLTQFNSGRIFDFNWSGDGKTLLLTRGDVSSDAVLIHRPGAGRRKSGEALSGAVNKSQRPSVVARSPADRAAITTGLNLSEPSAPADWDGRDG